MNSVPHESFALRFSDLQEIEVACREDEEQRAGRAIDWISARVSRRCAKWVDDWEHAGAPVAEKEADMKYRTPWWEELKRCVQGDHVPSTIEGWNHPVSGAFNLGLTRKACLLDLGFSDSRCVYYVTESFTSTCPASYQTPGFSCLGRQLPVCLLLDRTPPELGFVG